VCGALHTLPSAALRVKVWHRMYRGQRTFAAMLLVIVACAAALPACTPAISDERLAVINTTTPEQRGMAATYLMKRRLDLTDQQFAQVYPINVKYSRINQDALNKRRSKTWTYARIARCDRHRTRAMRRVLTDEQMAGYEAIKDSLLDHLREGAHSAEGP